METLSLFLWKSIVISGLLTAWYLLALRGRRLHQYNRIFLLSTLFVSLTIPFLNFQLFSIPAEATGRLAPVALFIQSAGDAAASAPVLAQPVQTHLDWMVITGIVAVTISIILLIILLVRIIKVRSMCRQYPAAQMKGINLVLTDSPKAPFTFLKYIFWNKSIPLQGDMGQLIFRHELTHIEQGHTYDKLACQVLTCIFWFNPFYWVIQKELNIVHEFIADEHAVDNRDTETFAMMVLRSYNKGSYLVPEHHFFSSPIKRRLAMLQNTTKPSLAKLRQFMAVPLVAGTILLFSIGCSNSITNSVKPAANKIVVLLDAAHGGLDAGAQSGDYIEKDICLKYATRLKQIAPIYNIEVRLIRDDDNYMPLSSRVAIANKTNPDVFISLHVGNEPGKEKEKGDFDIYIAGENTYTSKSNNYSNAIFQYMQQDGIIPGVAQKCKHEPGKSCSNCNRGATPVADQKDGIYVLKNARVPSMIIVLGNIKNQEGMLQVTDVNHSDVICHAILKGIVDGSTRKVGVGPGVGCGTITPPSPVSILNLKPTLPN